MTVGAEGTQPLAVGFLGLGIMGEAMARNILKSGLQSKLVVWNRTASKVRENESHSMQLYAVRFALGPCAPAARQTCASVRGNALAPGRPPALASSKPWFGRAVRRFGVRRRCARGFTSRGGRPVRHHVCHACRPSSRAPGEHPHSHACGLPS